MKMLSILILPQHTGVSNYFEREVKRRGFVVQRWDLREQEKRELEAEAKRKAGVSSRTVSVFGSFFRTFSEALSLFVFRDLANCVLTKPSALLFMPYTPYLANNNHPFFCLSSLSLLLSLYALKAFNGWILDHVTTSIYGFAISLSFEFTSSHAAASSFLSLDLQESILNYPMAI